MYVHLHPREAVDAAPPRIADDEVVELIRPHYWPGMKVADVAAVLTSKRVPVGRTSADLSGWLKRLAGQTVDAVAFLFMFAVWFIAYAVFSPADAASSRPEPEFITPGELVGLLTLYVLGTVLLVAAARPRPRRRP